MIRAVLDTNVIISALLFEGTANRFVPLWKKHRFWLVVSKEIIKEYLGVLAYPKFDLSAEEIKSIAANELLPFVHPVRVTEIRPVIQEDPSDDMFLACALAGKCQYLVSGDRHLLALKRYHRTSIISVAAFLNLFPRETS